MKSQSRGGDSSLFLLRRKLGPHRQPCAIFQLFILENWITRLASVCVSVCALDSTLLAKRFNLLSRIYESRLIVLIHVTVMVTWYFVFPSYHCTNVNMRRHQIPNHLRVAPNRRKIRMLSKRSFYITATVTN
jgi:hypothetical protein